MSATYNPTSGVHTTVVHCNVQAQSLLQACETLIPLKQLQHTHDTEPHSFDGSFLSNNEWSATQASPGVTIGELNP